MLSAASRMLGNLNQLNAGQIVGVLAVAATCFTAILAVVGALFVSFVNSRSARRLAREAAKREFQLNVVKPHLDSLDQRILLYDELINVGPALASALDKLVTMLTARNRSTQDDPQQPLGPLQVPSDLERAQQRLSQVQLMLGEARTVFRTGLFSFILSDHRISYKTHEWLSADGAFWDAAIIAGGITAAPEQLSTLRQRASKALSAAVELRIAIEDHIFGNRGWLRRGIYFIWAKSRTAWRKRISSLLHS